MTRTVSDAGERTRLGGDLSAYGRVLIEDADGVWRDLTDFHGVDWLVRIELGANIDDRAMTATLVLVRDGIDTDVGAMSIAPQIVASPANHKIDTSYAPLVNPARRVRVLTNTVKYGYPAIGNSALDPGLESGGSGSWTLGAGWSVASGSAHQRSGAYYLLRVAGADTTAQNNAAVPVVPGDQMSASGWVKSVGANGTTAVRLIWLNSSHVVIGVTDSTTIAPTGGVYVQRIVTGIAPAGAAFVTVGVTANTHSAGTWYADDFTLYAGQWKRVFDGKIDAVDPATSPPSTMTVRCRDRAAWLLNTWIETKRPYGSDAGAGTPIESVIQDIIDDNAIPHGATLVVPTSPDFNLGAFDQDDQSSVMDAIYNLALLQGGDVRYVFPNDGDTDPELQYIVPARDKVIPDWQFGPDEYLEIPRAPIDDSDVRNAITVDYFDSSVGLRQTEVRINAASIAAFGRRWGKVTVKDGSQIDTAAEADVLGDSIVADLGAPPFEHEMRTFYFWPLALGDLVRFLSNNVLYDQPQDLAVVGFTHVLENGEGYTTMQCRGTPAGAYRAWLGIVSRGEGPPPVIHGTYSIVAEDATSITLAVSGTVEGASAIPVVAWAWSTLDPPVSRVSGAAQMVFVPSGSQWKFAKPNPGTGDGMVGFLVGFDILSSVLLQIPIAEGTAFPAPTIDDPVVTVIDDPTDDFDIAWTVHSMPVGAQYKMFWRFSFGGSWNTHGFWATTSDTVAHAEHGQVIAALGTQNAEIQVYVEAFDSFGAHIAQSDVVTKTYHFEGFG